MTHRAETILAKVETLLTGLTTTGQNVSRGSLYDIHALPHVTIRKGQDAPIGDAGLNMSYIDRELSFSVRATVAASTQQETEINKILEEVYAAIFADYTLGLSFVVLTTLESDSDIQISTDGETPVAQVVSNYTVRYRHSFSDAGAG